MRVKLSYTVEEEDVLKEAAKIINLSAEDMGQCLGLFNEVQAELKGKDDSPPNTIKSLEMIEEFRKALLAVDTRLSEVMEIIDGYDDYRRGKLAKVATPELPQEVEGNNYSMEMFGAD
jgi:hypothetical protein